MSAMPRRGCTPPRSSLTVAAFLVCAAGAASAAEFESDGSSVRIDTTISHGLMFRVADRDDSLTSVNSDDGARNYSRGLVSNTSRLVSEIDIDRGAFGAFARVQGFYDLENRSGTRDYRPLSDEALARAGSDAEILDAYVTGTFDSGAMAIDARIGNQVLNWGESTFIQNGINVINPFDVARLRKPGAELRDGLLPVPLAAVSVAATDTLTAEAFYQFRWAETRIDPVGTYFATNDYAAPGGTRAFLSEIPGVTDRGGSINDAIPGISTAVNADLAAVGADCRPVSAGPPPEFAGAACQPAFDEGWLGVSRDPDREPGNAGQWGVALRWYSEALNDTEFGFYFVNHHSRVPLVSARFGTPAGFQSGLAVAGAVSRPGSATAGAIAGAVTPLVTAAVTDAVTQQVTQAVTAQVPAGIPNRDDVIAQQVAQQLASPQVQETIATEIRNGVGGQVAGALGGIVPLMAIDRYGQTAGYFVEYPEDLKVFGFSFNTLLGTTGWALQGEYSFRPDSPLQRTEASVIEEGLGPLIDTLSTGAPTPEALASLGTRLQGYVERDVSQLQATATRLFGPTLGADSVVFVAEAALVHVHDMPDAAILPLDTPGNEDGGDVADATSFGYRAATRFDYNNALGAARLSPYAQFQHDVNGNSPGAGGTFAEGRTALTLGLRLSWLDRVRADVSYTRYDGDTNYLSDRDFVSLSASYSF